ncbi:sensor histidine kinase [Candidatus Arthromitus sp. SFB-rat-Yit]|uniref:sensor histidine kinase n=1 Tax=Candidatus Arthromitus sp. SFB-rat-Yit TaxID=1041504 RepID=UPI000227A47E|nr:HAMP domain-containing sensor histidine kinase [Candidatus Arthromitus sp. SFB-rat-Yit]BAK81538.1 integral membrane sensor signal transduction histidine kinase [Candidatus Arthromitus sp. SFB-rat-Yit]
MKNRLSTFWQMSMMIFSIMVFIISISYVFQFFITRVWIIDYEKDSVKNTLEQIESFFYYHSIENADYLKFFEFNDADFWIYDSDRNMLISTDDIPNAVLYGKLPTKKMNYVHKVDGEEKVILNTPLYLNGKSYYVYIEKEVEIYQDFLDTLIPMLIVFIIMILVISLLSGMFVSRKFVNRLKFLKVTMENVKEKGISNRVEILNRNDEFYKIGIVFNSMMDELEKLFNQQKQFVHDASHELRTPLTILKGHLQMLNRWGKNDPETLDKSLKIASEELERLIKLVNDLLNLNKMETHSSFKVDEYIDVNQVIEEVIYGFDILSEDIEFNFDKTNNIYLKILREHLKQLVIIFVDNAIKYCDKDKKFINIRSYEENNRIYISIKDNGIGIKKEHILKVTDKFYRVDESRKYNNSFGIGLSIAAQLVKLYQGELEIISEFGLFTEVIVSFKK